MNIFNLITVIPLKFFVLEIKDQYSVKTLNKDDRLAGNKVPCGSSLVLRFFHTIISKKIQSEGAVLDPQYLREEKNTVIMELKSVLSLA